MAAIDKLYLHSYSELTELKQWALIYYPKLFCYFYDWAFNVTEKEFNEAIDKKAKETYNAYQKDWKRISSNGTISAAVAYIMSEWGWEDEKAAEEEARSIKANAEKTIEAIKYDTSMPIMNTPLSVDRRLKWTCPLPSIRIYLQVQCGVKEKWYYRIFWLGKKHFGY